MFTFAASELELAKSTACTVTLAVFCPVDCTCTNEQEQPELDLQVVAHLHGFASTIRRPKGKSQISMLGNIIRTKVLEYA